jgi:hypothetical protein
MSQVTVEDRVIQFLKSLNIEFNFEEDSKFRGQKYGTFLFYYGNFLDIFLLKYIETNNLKDPNNNKKIIFDEKLMNFFEILRTISEERETPLLLDNNSFYLIDFMTLFELCVKGKNRNDDEDLNRYDFREITKLEKKLKYELIKNNQDNYIY